MKYHLSALYLFVALLGTFPGQIKPLKSDGIEMMPVTGQVNDFVVCEAKTSAKKVKWIIEGLEEGQVKPSIEPLANPLKMMVLVKSPGKYKVWAVAAIQTDGGEPEIVSTSTFITVTASEDGDMKDKADKLDKGMLPKVPKLIQPGG